MIELRDVCFSAESAGVKKDILQNINLKIDERFVCLTGPNGSGKSTLARIIAGIVKPTSGQILFDGEDITDLTITERAKRGISFAFQQPVRFKGITVKDNLTGDVWTIDSLKPGESKTFYATYTVGEFDVTVGQVVNTATPTTDTPGVPTTPGSTVTRTGKYVVPLGIGASAQCGDCFE